MNKKNCQHCYHCHQEENKQKLNSYIPPYPPYNFNSLPIPYYQNSSIPYPSLTIPFQNEQYVCVRNFSTQTQNQFIEEKQKNENGNEKKKDQTLSKQAHVLNKNELVDIIENCRKYKATFKRKLKKFQKKSHQSYSQTCERVINLICQSQLNEENAIQYILKKLHISEKQIDQFKFCEKFSRLKLKRLFKDDQFIKNYEIMLQNFQSNLNTQNEEKFEEFYAVFKALCEREEENIEEIQSLKPLIPFSSEEKSTIISIAMNLYQKNKKSIELSHLKSESINASLQK